MKIYSWELINIVLIFPGIFALTLIIEGVSKIKNSNWMGIVSLCAGVILFLALAIGYIFLLNRKS